MRALGKISVDSLTRPYGLTYVLTLSKRLLLLLLLLLYYSLFLVLLVLTHDFENELTLVFDRDEDVQ